MAAQLKLLQGLPPLPRLVEVPQVDMSAVAPRLRGGESIMILPLTAPPKAGDLVLCDVLGPRPILARLAGWASGKPVLRRYDGLRLALLPSLMCKVIAIVLETGEEVIA